MFKLLILSVFIPILCVGSTFALLSYVEPQSAATKHCRIVKMYTITNCAPCVVKKRELDRENIPYEEYEINKKKEYEDTYRQKVKDANFPKTYLPVLEVNHKLYNSSIEPEKLRKKMCL